MEDDARHARWTVAADLRAGVESRPRPTKGCQFGTGGIQDRAGTW